jgi:hypothetical protein
MENATGLWHINLKIFYIQLIPKRVLIKNNGEVKERIP